MANARIANKPVQVGVFEFEVRECDGRINAYVVVGSNNVLTTTESSVHEDEDATVDEAVDIAEAVVRKLTGENGELFYRRVEPTNDFLWEVAV